jgi:MFS family permease
MLVFSKNVYMASLTSYYTFYLMETFHLSVRQSQVYLFIFLGAVAAGTLIGGPVGDRLGRKVVIWCSILGVLPFTLMLPHANLFWTPILTVIIGLILASAFRRSSSTGRNWCRARWAPSPGCSSAFPSAWAAWARRSWARWRTRKASASSISCAPSCPRSAC